MATEQSLSIANPHPEKTDAIQKLGLGMACLGVLILFVAFGGVDLHKPLFLTLSLSMMVFGTTLYAYRKYTLQPAGIKNNGVYFKSMTNRGVLGWITGIVLTGFYILLYWYPELLGQSSGDQANTGIVALFDPLSMFFKGKPASQWFVYGTLYTIAILALGIKFLYKYRHSRYHFIRTISVIISQLFLAYLIPEILEGLNFGSGDNYYGKDLKNIWPLNVYFTDPSSLNNMQKTSEQPVGMIFLVWGIISFTILTPVITYFVGKRWYCSWVCGCGGLAETAGDPYRHLSDKTVEAWNIERVIIHGVIVFVTLMTSLLLITYFTGIDFYLGINVYLLLGLLVIIIGGFLFLQKKKYGFLPNKKSVIVGTVIFVLAAVYFLIPVFNGEGTTVHFNSYNFRTWYGFFIGSAFSGVIGVGFYPLLGNRVWCRFGCPMAGYMGIIQRFKSKFRITTNGGQCISCGNCSTYCEQGIDVRAYAQKGQNIVRASCVGCGICAAVCPRGVLKLENGPLEKRIIDQPEMPGIKK